MSAQLVYRNQVHEILPGKTVIQALQDIGIQPETVIAVLHGEIISGEWVIQENDQIRLIHTISGGVGSPQKLPAISLIGMLVVSAYIATQMLADIASLKIGVVLGLAVDMGTFIYPITFTLRDLVHKVLGKRLAQALVIIAGGINFWMALYLMWVASVPGDLSWGLEQEFTAILAPVWRIVLASIAAEVISELVDTEIYHFVVTRITRRFEWLRVLASNGVSVPIDNGIFALGAFGGSLPWITVGEIFLFNLAIKYAMTLVSLPLIYITRNEIPDGQV